MKHVEYLCFHADRISFEPSKDQVIFFTPRNRHYRMGLSLIEYVDDNYELIVNEFQRKGLEFVFLPRTTRELNIPELYKYFRPDADEKDIESYQKGFFPEDMLNYLIESCPDIYNMPFGLLSYTGYRNESGYIFNYTPVFCEEQWFTPSSIDQLNLNLYNQLAYYLRYNAGSSYDESWERRDKLVRASFSCSCSMSESDLLFNDKEDDYACLESPVGNVKKDEKSIFSNWISSCKGSLAKPEPNTCVADENFSTEVMSLLGEFQRIAVELQKRGVWEAVLQRMFNPTQRLSRVMIHNNRIYLPDYNNMEIKMTPMAKSVYFLFLRHPEGIAFKDLPDYRNELREIYHSVSCYDDKNRMEQSINDVTDPTKNTINENASRIRKAFVSQFDNRLAENYYITGGRGEAKRITLPRQLVVWDNRLLK